MLVVPKNEQHTPEPEAASETSPKQIQGTESNGIFCTRLEQGVLCHCTDSSCLLLFKTLFSQGEVWMLWEKIGHTFPELFLCKNSAGYDSNYLSDIFNRICDPWDLINFSHCSRLVYWSCKQHTWVILLSPPLPFKCLCEALQSAALHRNWRTPQMTVH